ncbi:MAG: hypothetical protein OXI87_11435 [Albidovulum sp.]|nr:hypothetical protein [Albidovulum sp.]
MTAYQNSGIDAAFELRAKRRAAENSIAERELSETRASLLGDGIPLPGQLHL